MSPSHQLDADNSPPTSTPTHPTARSRKIAKKLRNRVASIQNEPATGDGFGDRVTRIYPRELTQSPPSLNLLSSASPTDHATSSPLLSALGATKAAAQYTNEWTKNLPNFTAQASPGDGISIPGSPLNTHVSPNDRGRLQGQFAMSTSPPGANMRPLSHPNHNTNFGGRLQASPHRSPRHDRRPSMYSQLGARRHSHHFSLNPPLPHQFQSHFGHLPGLDAGLGLGLDGASQEASTAGENGYFCGFDTLSMAGEEISKTAENVLLVGCQGGLDVFRIDRGRMDMVGHLEGLKGGVIGAKILPNNLRNDPFFSSRPLIALTLHGPILEAGEEELAAGDAQPEAPGHPDANESSSIKIIGYQTSVEVFSLKERRKLAVLYQSPLISIPEPIHSPIFRPPPPSGDFVVDAKGLFIIVASGASGEIFVFAPYIQDHTDFAERFRCIGKFWTTVQKRERHLHSTASSTTGSSQEDNIMEEYGVPVFSLSDRWLALVPPASTSLLPMNGTSLVSPYYDRPPGLAHHTVPPQPAINCAVDAPQTAGLLNRWTREGTQVAIQGAKWATDRGMQAIKNYMNKNAQAANNYQYGAEAQQNFPPTHGHSQAQPRQDSTVISIFDLQRLNEVEETRNKVGAHAMATMPAYLGCSFLSFSPSGLMLMTVNKKGDFWDVWDLKSMASRRVRKTARVQLAGPHVRQVARFTRMTVAHVVDVSWSAPRAEKLAVVTDRGTVHLFRMPSSAFQWPPLRRLRPRAGPTTSKDEQKTGGGGAVSNAMQAINGTARPFLDAMRGSSNSSRFTLSSLGMTPAAGAKSGKAVAVGVGKSINNIRYAGNNKLALPHSASGAKPNSMRWMTGKGRGSLALVAGGVLQIHQIQMRPASSQGPSADAAAISKKKLAEFPLGPINDTLLPSAIETEMEPDSGDADNANELHGQWLPRSLPHEARRHSTAAMIHEPSPAPLSFSEIETNPPYQPFHTDRRVTRFLFQQPTASVQNSSSNDYPMTSSINPLPNLHHLDDDSPWLFGQDIEATRISSLANHTYDSNADDSDSVASMFENRLILRDGEEDVSQVIVTTRRRRPRREAGASDDGDGFFEDDCEVLDFAEDRV